MVAALAFGCAMLLSGWFASRGLIATDRARSLWRLGYQLPSSRSVADSVASVVRRLPAGLERHRFAVAALIGAVTGYPLIGPVGLVAGSIVGAIVVSSRKARESMARRELLDRQLGDAVLTVAAAVRAGLSVRQAMAEAAEGTEPPLRQELQAVVRRLETGEPLDAALSRLDLRLGLSDAALVVNALGVHRRTGGDLPSLLDEIAGVIRLRLEDRRAVRSLTAQARSSGVVLAVLPIGFVALLSGTGGDGLGDFYRSPFGASLLLVALCLQALGFAWMRRIVKGVDVV